MGLCVGMAVAEGFKRHQKSVIRGRLPWRFFPFPHQRSFYFVLSEFGNGEGLEKLEWEVRGGWCWW